MNAALFSSVIAALFAVYANTFQPLQTIIAPYNRLFLPVWFLAFGSAALAFFALLLGRAIAALLYRGAIPYIILVTLIQQSTYRSRASTISAPLCLDFVWWLQR